MLFLIILVLFVLLLVYSHVSFLRSYREVGLPGPSTWPLIGNAHLFTGDSGDFLKVCTRLCLQYGTLFQVHILGNRTVFASDVNFLEALTTSMEYIDKAKLYSALHSWLGLGLLTSTGPRWQTHRKFLTPAFHFNILLSFLPVFLKNKDILLKKLDTLTNEKYVDLFPIIAANALDNITESAMGVSVNAQGNSDSTYVKAVKENARLVMLRQFNPFLQDDVFFNLHPYKKRSDEACAILHAESRRVIEKRRLLLSESNVTLKNYDDFGIKNKRAFLDLLLLGEVDGQKLDMESIREEVDTFMFEGHDTTTSAVSFCLYNIAIHEEVQEKVLKEQLLIFGSENRNPDHRDLANMKYLEAVIKESFRLYPPVPFAGRMITKDSYIGGVFIPKDTNIAIDIFNLQRNPKHFKEPLKFRPERFIEDNETKPFTWIPFSAGPRNCIGQKFALMQLKVTVSCVVRRYRLRGAAAAPELIADLVLGSRNGVRVRLQPRVDAL